MRLRQGRPPPECNTACTRMPCTPSCSSGGSWAPQPSHLATPRICRDFIRVSSRTQAKVGQVTTIVLQSGGKWGTFLSRSRSGVAGLLPLRHLGSTEPFAALDMSLGLHGTFDHSLDAKNRLTVPSKLRAGLLRGGLPRQGRGPLHLAVSLHDLFGADGRSPRGLNPLSAQARELNRFFRSNAHAVELDSAGRVMLGAKLARARGHRSGRRRHRRRRLLGALGPLHLGGLPPGPLGAWS